MTFSVVNLTYFPHSLTHIFDRPPSNRYILLYILYIYKVKINLSLKIRRDHHHEIKTQYNKKKTVNRCKSM